MIVCTCFCISGLINAQLKCYECCLELRQLFLFCHRDRSSLNTVLSDRAALQHLVCGLSMLILSGCQRMKLINKRKGFFCFLERECTCVLPLLKGCCSLS